MGDERSIRLKSLGLRFQDTILGLPNLPCIEKDPTTRWEMPFQKTDAAPFSQAARLVENTPKTSKHQTPPWEGRRASSAEVEILHPEVSGLDCERCPKGFRSVGDASVTLFQQIVAGAGRAAFFSCGEYIV